MANNTSDDELRASILTEFRQVHKLAPADYTENCTNVVMSLIRQHTEQVALEARIDERESMQFFDDDGQETHKPYVQYRYTGSGLKLSWDDRTKELEQLTTTHKGEK